MSADVTRTRVASIEICATTEKQVSMRDRTRFCPEVLGASPGEVCENEMICGSYPAGFSLMGNATLICHEKYNFKINFQR